MSNGERALLWIVGALLAVILICAIVFGILVPSIPEDTGR